MISQIPVLLLFDHSFFMIQLRKDRLIQDRTQKYRPESEKEFEAKTRSKIAQS